MITSLANAQIKHVIALQTKAKVRRQDGCYVVEGIKMIREVPKDELVKLYISESAMDKTELKEIIENCEYEVVKDSVFDNISDTVTPQGVLGIVKQKQYDVDDILKAPKRCIVILESIQDPGNLGTIMRTAEGAGAAVVMNKTTVDIYNPKVIRSTMGSIYRVPFMITQNLGMVIGELKKQGIKVYAAHLKGEKYYYEAEYKDGAAFLIGNEGNGLTDEMSNLADEYIKIPMEGKVESLNASVAAAILMYKAAEGK